MNFIGFFVKPLCTLIRSLKNKGDNVMKIQVPQCTHAFAFNL